MALQIGMQSKTPLYDLPHWQSEFRWGRVVGKRGLDSKLNSGACNDLKISQRASAVSWGFSVVKTVHVV